VPPATSPLNIAIGSGGCEPAETLAAGARALVVTTTAASASATSPNALAPRRPGRVHLIRHGARRTRRPMVGRHLIRLHLHLHLRDRVVSRVYDRYCRLTSQMCSLIRGIAVAFSVASFHASFSALFEVAVPRALVVSRLDADGKRSDRGNSQ
jgi:hypothetical protein